MWIERIQIDKFGGLRGFEMQLGEGLVVIYGGNESGKTTLMAFVRAMLYGLNGKSPSLAQNERKKYMPWGETAMGGSLLLNSDRGRYEIVRVFGQTKKSDTCSVINAETGEVLPLLAGQEPGQALLGIEESVFCNTLFVSFRGGRVSDGAELAERIRNRMDTGSENVDLACVLERLQSAKNAILPRTQGKGELAAVRAELDDARRQLLRENELRQEALRLEQLLQNGAAERQDALQHSLDHTGQRIAQQESVLAEHEVQEAVVYRRMGRRTALLGVLAGLLAAVSIAGGRIWNPLAYSGLAAAAGFAVWAIVIAARRRSVGSRAAVDAVLRELSQLRQDQAMLRQQMERLSSGEANEMQLRNRLALEKIRQELAQLEESKTRIQMLQKREQDLLQRTAALETAIAELRAAAKERREGVAPQLMQGMEDMLCGLTGAHYARAALTEDMEPSVQTESGSLRPWAYFSGGTVEQMYLALRLSLVKYLENTHGALPLLLDDPLAQYDDERAEDALQMLKHYAADGRQVLLLTCRARDAQGVDCVIRLEKEERHKR